jgi:hypothetical protein
LAISLTFFEQFTYRGAAIIIFQVKLLMIHMHRDITSNGVKGVYIIFMFYNIRRDLGRITQYLKGINSNHLNNCIQSILNNNRIHCLKYNEYNIREHIGG